MAATERRNGVEIDDEWEPSTAIVRAVSSHTGQPVMELPPLYEAVDPDALDALFSGRQTLGVLTFAYAGHDVTVRTDQTVDVIAHG
ncbi:HalOD1 output domain-containing protein [Halomicrobium sp. HM KBTZ05]|uniref:HalOD1 output domain-containing protein n=1 Tax=Halomicrobium sp. HM KBTZ05 TaxID=3242663 RepID=UPI0035576767